jgi:membrane-bound serine protease (ClpP class)
MWQSLTFAYVLIIAGLLLLAAELFLPTGGVLLVLSLAAIVLGVSMTFLYSDDPTTGILTLAGVFIAIPIIASVLMHYWPRTRIGRRFFLSGPEADATLATMPVNLELEQLRGRFGRAESALRPSGIVDFDGQRIDTITEGMMVDPGQ